MESLPLCSDEESEPAESTPVGIEAENTEVGVGSKSAAISEDTGAVLEEEPEISTVPKETGVTAGADLGG